MHPTQKPARVAKCRSRGSWFTLFRCSSNKQRDDDDNFANPSQCSNSASVGTSAVKSERPECSMTLHAKRISFFSRFTGARSKSNSSVSMPVIVVDETPKQDIQIDRVKPEPKRIRGRPKRHSQSIDASNSQLSRAATVSPVRHPVQCEVYPEPCRKNNDPPNGGRCRNDCEDKHRDSVRATWTESDSTRQQERSALEIFPAKSEGSAITISFRDSRPGENQSQDVSMHRSISSECFQEQAGSTRAERPLPQDRHRIQRFNSCTTKPVAASMYDSSRESWGVRNLLQTLVGSSVAPSISSASCVGAMDVNNVLHASTSLADSGTGPCRTAPSSRVVNGTVELSAMKKPAQGELVWLNIYDVQHNLQLVNDLAKQVGSGAFHAGVEVYGQEWSFGWKEYGSGVYCSNPMRNDRHKYRESVALGATLFRSDQVSSLIFRLRQEWVGNEYELLTRNCCHFADAMCCDLAVDRVPEWVMHLAGAGVSFVEGVDHAVLRASEAAEMAVNKAAEFDERYQISRKVDSFLQQEIDIDEAYLEQAARGLFTKAMEKLDSVGALAGQVLNDVEGARRRLSARDIFVQPHDKDDIVDKDNQVFCHSVSALSPTPTRGNRHGGMVRSSAASPQGVPVVDMTNLEKNIVSRPSASAADEALEFVAPPTFHQDQQSAGCQCSPKDEKVIVSPADVHEEQQLAEVGGLLSEERDMILPTVPHSQSGQKGAEEGHGGGSDEREMTLPMDLHQDQELELQCSQSGQNGEEGGHCNGTSTV